MVDASRIERAVITCGGTGGHVYPAVAVAREILARDPGARLTFVGRPDSFEQRVLEREGFRMEAVGVGRLAGQSALVRARTAAFLPFAVARAAALLRRHRPQVVIGTGGFASAPSMVAALLLGLPTLVQEQNAVAGLTNRLLRRLARRVALAHHDADVDGRRCVVTGNPVRPAFFEIEPWRPREPFVLLVMGGSQGARTLNRAALAAARQLGDLAGRVRVVLQAGPRWEQECRAQAPACPVEVEVHAFLHDVPRRLAEAGLVACRAGASTVAELCAAGRPALLVPYPHAAGDHQSANARALVEAGAAEAVPDASLTGETLAARVRAALGDPDGLERRASAARELARPDAAERIVDLAEEAAASRRVAALAGRSPA